MDDQPTCGQGLAEHSALPAKLAQLTDAMATMLEVHMTALDLTDENAKLEGKAYAGLAKDFRDIARRLRETARRMAGYRDLPMARHDVEVMSSLMVRDTFREYVRGEEELLALLQRAVARDRTMLEAMAGGMAGA